ncbi:zinc finger, CCHC-type containing protein [Tanacetum coccineum]
MIDVHGKLSIFSSGGMVLDLITPTLLVKRNTSVTLLDSGNLVLHELFLDGSVKQVLWQSFDYPTNKLLPEMKLGINFMSGHRWSLSSWASDQLPTPRSFTLTVDPNDTSQLIILRRGNIHWTSGTWQNGQSKNSYPKGWYSPGKIIVKEYAGAIVLALHILMQRKTGKAARLMITSYGPIPATPVPTVVGQQVLPETLAAHAAWVKGQKEIYEYDSIVQNYNMHSMGKTVNELHAMLKLHEQTLPKRDALALHAIRAGKIPPPPKKEDPAKDSNKKLPQGASTSGIFTKELFTFPGKSWVYDTGCGTHICNTTQGFRRGRKLKPGALSLYMGNGQRAAVEAIGSYDLCFPSGLVIVLHNCHYAHSKTRGVS